MAQTIAHLRRRNLLFQFGLFQKDQIQAGALKGHANVFAERVHVHPSLLSKLKGVSKDSRDISDRMARQIETALGLSQGWLDAEQDNAPLLSAERSFLDLALQWYRGTDASSRRAMRKFLASAPSLAFVHDPQRYGVEVRSDSGPSRGLDGGLR